MTNNPYSGSTPGSLADDAKKAAGDFASSASNTGSAVKDKVSDAAAAIKDDAARRAADLKSQASDLAHTAGDRARSAAETGKTKAADAVGTLATLIEDIAPTLDSKLGTAYGDYARSAAKSFSGFADTIETKNVDEIVTQSKDYVKKNPAVAVGVAAVAGFVLTRLLKGGSGHKR